MVTAVEIALFGHLFFAAASDADHSDRVVRYGVAARNDEGARVRDDRNISFLLQYPERFRDRRRIDSELPAEHAHPRQLPGEIPAANARFHLVDELMVNGNKQFIFLHLIWRLIYHIIYFENRITSLSRGRMKKMQIFYLPAVSPRCGEMENRRFPRQVSCGGKRRFGTESRSGKKLPAARLFENQRHERAPVPFVDDFIEETVVEIPLLPEFRLHVRGHEAVV